LKIAVPPDNDLCRVGRQRLKFLHRRPSAHELDQYHLIRVDRNVGRVVLREVEIARDQVLPIAAVECKSSALPFAIDEHERGTLSRKDRRYAAAGDSGDGTDESSDHVTSCSDSLRLESARGGPNRLPLLYQCQNRTPMPTCTRCVLMGTSC